MKAVVLTLVLGVLLVGSLAERPKRNALAARPKKNALAERPKRNALAAMPKRNDAAGKANDRLLQESTPAPSPRPTVGDPRPGGAEAGPGTFDPTCGTCTEPQSSPGCSEADLEMCVCDNDPFCCETEWDEWCVDGLWYCEPTCFVDEEHLCAGTCGFPHSEPGCSVPEIEQCVCAADSWCCGVAWDSICVGEVWSSPCHVDCDCEGDNYYGDTDLPAYWETIADQYSVNKTNLGFNAAEGKWCYGLSNTCIKWGEWNGLCDDSTFACAGYVNTPQSNGHGTDQMAMIAEMVLMGGHEHHMCPVCEYNDVCWNGEYPGTDNATTATFTDCDCVEHHSGFPLIFEGYWWNEAIYAGLNPMHVTQRNDKWYYNEDYTCVAKGSYGDPCDSGALGCVCSGVTHYGSASAQMGDVLAADTNGGVHPDCPY